MIEDELAQSTSAGFGFKDDEVGSGTKLWSWRRSAREDTVSWI